MFGCISIFWGCALLGEKVPCNACKATACKATESIIKKIRLGKFADDEGVIDPHSPVSPTPTRHEAAASGTPPTATDPDETDLESQLAHMDVAGDTATSNPGTHSSYKT
jgi:hypothetical protein